MTQFDWLRRLPPLRRLPGNIAAAVLLPAVSFLLALATLFALSIWEERPTNNIVDSEYSEYSEEETEAAEEADDAPPDELADEQAEILPEPPSGEDEESWLEYRIRRGDLMENILNATHAAEDMRQALTNPAFKSHRRMRIKDTVYFKLDDNGKLAEFLYKTSPEYYLTAGRDAAGQAWAKEETPQLKKHRLARANRIETSLFNAANKADMTDAAIDALIGVLETQIDFYRDVRAGDSFRVIYDEWEDDYGGRIKTDNILAFEYNSIKSSRPRVIRGVLNPADGYYYAPDGGSLSRAFLPAPLKYGRISSTFSRRRFHPVLKRWRAHRGIDYAARSGTPVRATADGVVTKATREGGYGKVIFIKHFNIYTTVYAHLRKFAPGIKRGKEVKQGDIIGQVGQTGLATGPHLHYEFRIRGKHKDPLSVDIPRQVPPLKGDALAEFKRAAAPLLAELNALEILS